MSQHRFRLVNVFVGPVLLTDNALSGNPLCVFEDGRGLGDRRMMALARQFNLSETTFVLPPPADNRATAQVRILTPTHDPKLFEMRFAGHPTLGTAHVLRDLHDTGDAVTLLVPAGHVPVAAQGDVWTLTAPFEGRPGVRPEPMPAADIAAIVGLDADDLGGGPLWIDTGTEQLIVPLASVDAVSRATPAAERSWPGNRAGARNCYVFAFDPDAEDTAADDGPSRQRIRSRFFIRNPGSGSLVEDPGTGSACANLGGWMIATGAARPGRFAIDQGIEMQRPCRLLLDTTADGRVRVGGRVVEIARGEVTLPD